MLSVSTTKICEKEKLSPGSFESYLSQKVENRTCLISCYVAMVTHSNVIGRAVHIFIKHH